MIKYFAEYHDTENVLHRFEIENDDYTDAPIEIGGYVVLEYLDLDDVLESIRGSALKVFLDANIDVTFDDLYSEQERTFKITYYRESQVKFIGWINPDGLFQDWVNDHWEISLDASGGLGYLENLSYPASGGLEKEIDIISKCLSRTGIDLEIYTNVITNYEGQPGSTDVFDNVYQDSGRFIKEDGETTMSCDEVLRGVLEKYCASIYQYDGKWFVNFVPNLTLASNSYYVYNSDGTFNRMDSYSLGTTVGSHINDFYPHHCSGNQKIKIQPSIGAYRINYKYGFINSINDNPGMLNDGSTITGWNTPNPDIIDLNANGSVDIKNNNIAPDNEFALQSAANVLLPEGKSLNIKARLQSRNGANTMIAPFRAQIVANGSADTYYLAGNLTSENPQLEWTTDSNRTVYAQFDQENIYYDIDVKTPEIIEQCVVNIIIFELPGYISETTSIRIDYFGIGISPDNENAQGEFHTFERILNPSSVVRDTKEVNVADSPLNLYAGALYENDQSTLTTTWVNGAISAAPILYIMGMLTMQTLSNPAKVFEGDVYGEVRYPGGYYIDGVNGKFIITYYRQNTKTNITEIKAVEVFVNSISEDTSHLKTIDYGDSETPTIN